MALGAAANAKVFRPQAGGAGQGEFFSVLGGLDMAILFQEPNRYARKIIGHLYHLFVPRKGEGERDDKM